MVDEKYTRPQGLYNHKDVDHKKLRKLILESKLAPCYPGDEESAHDREECPICFLVAFLSTSMFVSLQLFSYCKYLKNEQISQFNLAHLIQIVNLTHGHLCWV